MNRNAAATKIQAFIRSKYSTTKSPIVTSKNKKMVVLRRMQLARQKRKMNNAAIVIQAMIRGVLQRSKYRMALQEKQEFSEIKSQIEQLKAKLATADRDRDIAVQEVEDRFSKGMTSNGDDDMGSIEISNISLKARLDESEKVLDFLKRERKRLMGLVKTHKGRCERVAEQNATFIEANDEIRARMEEVRQHMLILENNKITLANNKDVYLNQLKAYKKEIQRGQAYRQSEDDIRNVYQDAVERIVGLVQEECKHDDLVEDIYILAMECCDGDFNDDIKYCGSIDSNPVDSVHSDDLCDFAEYSDSDSLSR